MTNETDNELLEKLIEEHNTLKGRRGLSAEDYEKRERLRKQIYYYKNKEKLNSKRKNYKIKNNYEERKNYCKEYYQKNKERILKQYHEKKLLEKGDKIF